jgi:hypothetical protein
MARSWAVHGIVQALLQRGFRRSLVVLYRTGTRCGDGCILVNKEEQKPQRRQEQSRNSRRTLIAPLASTPS